MANLINQECCSQKNGYWTNGTITVVGGTNFQDTVGISFVNSLGLGPQPYCSNCPVNLQYIGEEVLTYPGNENLSQKCCIDYNLTYNSSNSKCYKACQITGLQEVFDPNYSEVPIGSSYDPEPYVIYLKDSNGQDLSTTCCSNLYGLTGEGYVTPNNFYDITSTGFVAEGYKCHKCPPAAGELDYLSVGYQLGTNTITVTGTLYDGVYTELLYLGQSIKTEECCFPRLLSTGLRVNFQNNKCYIL